MRCEDGLGRLSVQVETCHYDKQWRQLYGSGGGSGSGSGSGQDIVPGTLGTSSGYKTKVVSGSATRIWT